MSILEKICKFSLNLKIVSFFHENPSMIDTARGISSWLNHDYRQVKRALDVLVSQDILIAHRTSSTTAYGYTQNKELIVQIGKFLKNKGGNSN